MNQHYPFVNIPLPYAYDALEPYVDTKTMELHHDKHLQTYINNLNTALEHYPCLHHWSLEQLILNADKLPMAIRTAVKNNAGGVYNHEFYFSVMDNTVEKTPTGTLGSALVKEYGSFDKWKELFLVKGTSVFGSGYTWLVMSQRGELEMITTANQDTPLTQNVCPILALDVWEHAYYLKHYNVRADYIADWFQVVDWKKANERYMYCADYMCCM